VRYFNVRSEQNRRGGLDDETRSQNFQKSADRFIGAFLGILEARICHPRFKETAPGAAGSSVLFVSRWHSTRPNRPDGTCGYLPKAQISCGLIRSIGARAPPTVRCASALKRGSWLARRTRRLPRRAALEIKAYEALFFNVRDRLDAKDFILLGVVRTTELGDPEKEEDGQLWKLLGYLGGSHVLEALIDGFPEASWPEQPEDVGGFLPKLAVGSLQQKAAVAALVRPEEDRLRRRLKKPRVKRMRSKATGVLAATATEEVRRDRQLALEAPTVTATIIEP
jgi:hypothetical protein